MPYFPNADQVLDGDAEVSVTLTKSEWNIIGMALNGSDFEVQANAKAAISADQKIKDQWPKSIAAA